MEKIFRKFFSMEMMTLGLIIFLVAIARATFIESAHGTQASKAVIYNTKWFEWLMIYLSFSLVANIIRYRMWVREKVAILAFHVSFIVIIIGAALTRYVGFEGMMLIREGEKSNTIYSADAYLQVLVHDGKKQFEANRRLILADIAHNDFSFTFQRPDEKGEIQVEYLNFIPNSVSKLEKGVEGGMTILEIVTPGEMGMDTNYVQEGTLLQEAGFTLAFDYPNPPAGSVIVKKTDNGYSIQSPAPIQFLLMSDQSSGVIPQDSLTGFYQGRLYTTMGQNFVFKAEHKRAKLSREKSPVKDSGTDVLYVKVTSGNQTKILELEGGQGRIPVPSFFEFDGLNYKVAYGAMPVTTPFYVALRDFQLDRYPGSDSPSSFASEVTVIDEEKDVQFDRRIFMNTVMDYRGYRFFQSSYDPDEMGTRLSVNQDTWGTNVTYLGYLLMSLAMIMTLFAPASRFRELNRKIAGLHAKKATLTTLLFLLSFSLTSLSQDHEHIHSDGEEHDHTAHQHDMERVDSSETTTNPFASRELTKEEQARLDKINNTPIGIDHAKKLESLVIQDYEGRMKPFQTVALEVIRKIHRKDTYNGLTATQVFMDMHLNPDYWMTQPIIAVSNQTIREKLAISDKFASFRDFFDPITGGYLLEEQVAKSNQKPANKQSDYDKQIIKVNERLQILNITFSFQFLRIIPIVNDSNNKWYHPLDMSVPKSEGDSLIRSMFSRYMSSLIIGKETGDFAAADELLDVLKLYQRTVGQSIIPSESKINMEIRYNNLNIFQRLSYGYLLLGFVLLVLFFTRVFTSTSNWTKIPNIILISLMILSFIFHGAGLGMRWYISGHAPWSNGYEALVFIAWITVLAGLIFSKKSSVTLGATAILTFFMLFVAHMNQLDPEITNLVPVLQSYWLMIHVAIITGSYGFLGLGAILAIVALILFITRTSKNGKKLTLHINEISYIIELTTTIGLFMLTIGTFLGGVWANESWGRYWGWDPKETWALVSILVYAVLLHLRFIPKASSKLVFNSVAMWSYGAILFTFFGVNFFLVGLHSYAEGEADTMWPTWVIYTVIGFALFNALAILRGIQYKKSQA
jgi:cytochrome c-type biogenesis protein CcsB